MGITFPMSKQKEFGNLDRTTTPAKPTELQNNFSQGFSGILKLSKLNWQHQLHHSKVQKAL